MTIQISTTDPRSLKALALLSQAGQFARVTTHDGQKFYAVPSSQAGVFYLANASACECPDFTHRQQCCKHVLAVRLLCARAKAQAPKLTPKAAAATYRAIFGTDDDPR